MNRDGRFAPSPTGPLHLGNLRTALLAYVFARSAGARFRLRIDDLDRERSRPGHERGQLEDLRAVGIGWDGEIVRQSERGARYAEAIAGLETYPCFCTRREIREAASAPHAPAALYPGTCRDLTALRRAERGASGRAPALRLRAPRHAHVAFDDRVQGRFEGPVDDIVVRRSDGTAAYNLAVVVDDADQGVGEVVRGADLLHATPGQLFVSRLLDLPEPSYAHVALLVGPDGGRLAKSAGAITLADRPEPAPQLAALLLRSAGLPGALGEAIGAFDPALLGREATPWS